LVLRTLRHSRSSGWSLTPTKQRWESPRCLERTWGRQGRLGLRDGSTCRTRPRGPTRPGCLPSRDRTTRHHHPDDGSLRSPVRPRPRTRARRGQRQRSRHPASHPTAGSRHAEARPPHPAGPRYHSATRTGPKATSSRALIQPRRRVRREHSATRTGPKATSSRALIEPTGGASGTRPSAPGRCGHRHRPSGPRPSAAGPLAHPAGLLAAARSVCPRNHPPPRNGRPRRRRGARARPSEPPRHPRNAPTRPNEPPRHPRNAPTRPNEPPRHPRNAPTRPNEPPRHPRNAPTRPSERPARAPSPSRRRTRRTRPTGPATRWPPPPTRPPRA
jgi:hypothetical protein